MKKIYKLVPSAVHADPSGPSRAAVAVEVQTNAAQAHIQMGHKLCREIVTQTGQLAGKYLELCLYIRSNKVAPKLVSIELGRLGFKRSRVSEINKVANASDKLFSDYQAKMIGFDKCLDLARVEVVGEKAKLTEAGKLLVDAQSLTAADVESATADEPSSEGRAGSGPTTFEKIQKAMDTILTLAPLLRSSKFPVSREIAGYEVELIKVSAKRAANI